MTSPVFYSLIYYIVSTIAIMLGLYILFRNAKGTLNRVFFLFCLALSIWAFAFSVANSAPDYETALLWLRVASLGWGCLASLQLHFFLLLTGQDRLLKKKWIYFILYLPCLVIFYLLGLDDKVAGETFVLVNTSFGWIDVFSTHLLDLYVIIHYVVFSLPGLWLLWKWGKKSNDPIKYKLVLLLISAYSLTLIASFFTDIIINTYTDDFILQIAPILCLIPLSVIFYATKCYGFMTLTKNQPTEPGKILSPDKLVQFYQLITMVFIVLGIVNFASQYFFARAAIASALLLSGVLIGLGIILQWSQQLPVRRNFKERILFLVLAASIPLIAIQNNDSNSFAIGAVPIVFIMLSVIYNKRRIMLWLGGSIILTQIWVWSKASPAAAISGNEHMVRLITYLIVLGLAFYINRIYILRLEENENQILFQKMVSRLSTAFSGITNANKVDTVNELFALSADYFQLDHACLISFSPSAKQYEWIKNGSENCQARIVANEQDLNRLMNLPWQDDLIHIPNIQKFPGASTAKTILERLNNHSLLAIKVKNENDTMGILFFTSSGINLWRDEDIELLKIIANLASDVLLRIETENIINRLAYYDALTGLPNRTLFINRLEQAIHLAKRSEKLIGVIFIDLDCFKGINDTIGHDGGDEVLKQVAARLTSNLRKHDTVTRFGGDEFIIQITQINQIEDIQKIAANLIKELSKPVTVNERQFYLTASAGIAVFPLDGEDAASLIKNADLSMYNSKNCGKNQYTLCSNHMKKDVQKELQLTNHLYRALDRNEMFLVYQPQLSLLTRQYCGVEALLRWKHPDLGTILPERFIPLAEKTGLIHPLGEWVLETACRQNKQWQEQGFAPLLMTVNMSIEQLRNPDLVALVAEVLRKTGLEARYLGMDIHEGIAKEPDSLLQVLGELKGLGISIAIEGFGVECASLARLHMLPIDRVKINMQFAQAISRGKKEEDIVRTIIQLAQNLHFNVVAEGVETDPQLAFFCEQHCDEVQGFNIVKPMPAKDLEVILFGRSNNQYPVLANA